MKKKITALFLCVALLATAIVGASLAYFTDTDNENQHLRRRQCEDRSDRARAWRQRAQQAFTQDKKLYPIVGSARARRMSWVCPPPRTTWTRWSPSENTGSEKALYPCLLRHSRRSGRRL